MRCRECDYPLWNLKARECPECGASFRPSDYEFVPQSVRFCCPHCDHPYYGTDATGHVEPRALQCLHCGQPVVMDEMVLRPGLGVEEELTSPDTMPWLDRRQRGRVRAWFQMIGRGLTAPSHVIAATPPRSPMPQAWIFAAVSTCIFVVAGASLQSWFLAMWFGMVNAWTAGFTGFGRATIWVFAFAALGATFALTMLVLWLWTLSAHGVLRLTGKVKHPYRRTCQALLYSAGANVFSAVPCFGFWVGGVWWTVSAILMLKRGQGVHGGRAAIAVALLPGILIGANVALYVGWILVMTGMGPTSGPWSLDPTSRAFHTSVVNFSAVSYGQQHAGVGPAHALELVLSDSAAAFSWNLTTPLVCDPSTKTTEDDVPVGDGTLADFNQASRSEKLRIVSDMIESVPGGVVAHRLGDFVFTYHGANLSAFNQQLWTVVMLPDPDVNGPAGATDPVIIGTSDYNVIETTVSDLQALLVQQNRQRATFGLPPLPDLTTVTHERPALAPAASGDQNSQDNP